MIKYVDIVDNTGRTSSFEISNEKRICVIGGLTHCLEFAPRTHTDANNLIAWLNKWKENNPDKSTEQMVETKANALRWWHDELSMYSQNHFIKKHFPQWEKSIVRGNSSMIETIYRKEIKKDKSLDK